MPDVGPQPLGELMAEDEDRALFDLPDGS